MTNATSEPHDETTPVPAPKKERSGGWVVVATVGLLAALVGGGWVAAYYFAGDELPHGTQVSGVRIGDRSAEQARAALEQSLGSRLDQPVTLLVGGTSVPVKPAAAGLVVDYAATVAQAGGERSWDPRKLWDHYTGGDRIDPVVTVDEAALAAVQQTVDKTAGEPAKDGAVTFTETGVETTDPVVGRAVDPDELRSGLVDAALAEGRARTVELALHEDAPEIDAADLQAALQSFANPAMSAPVTLVFGKSPVELTPREFSGTLSMKPEGGQLVPALDGAKLEQLVAGTVATDAGAPVDATVRLVDGRPRVVPAKPGVTYKPEDVAAVFLGLLTKPEGQRRLEVPSQVAEPEFTTKEARALRIRRQVSTFTTYYPHADYRNVNIGRAGELIDGTVLKPGETFSLNGTVGERTAANGFTAGYIISDGVLKQDLGGGVSQMATTLFNAMFFAGLKDVEHKPHSFYIDRYPVGREATVAWGAVDLRFQNDTPYGVLIDTQVIPSTVSRQGQVTVTMWSTKVWDIDTTTSERYNFRPPQERVITDDPDCEPHAGWAGFDIDVTRIFRKPGSPEVVKQETFHTAYTASDHVECRTTPKPRQGPAPAAAPQ